MSAAPDLPNTPKSPPPPGACDTHTHIFGPLERFPLAVTGSYEPPATSFEVHRAMLDRMAFAHAVLVQPAPYALDCRALLDACGRAPDRLRGIAVANDTATETVLRDLWRGGIRGLRFVEVPDPQGGGRYRGSVGFDEIPALAPRMAAVGLHAQLWADCERLVAHTENLLTLGVPIVVDHIGRPDVTRGANDPAFARLISLAAEGRIWIKLTVCRASRKFPDYDDVRPLHDALVANAPHRLLWGSDWPHVRMGALTPDAGHLVDLFDQWIGPDQSLRRKILVENPRVLYGFA